ncbi:MAG TPA: UDP-galactopyranose mutase [Acidimicrobiales bacterium]|nr:UDP-galactopyranose mutase [Acidimicrobiales bacterium]
MKVDWLVVGAGLSGTTLAERIATELDQRVLVVDRRPHVAGNAYDETDDSGVLVHRYGAHIFHTASERVWDYLSRFTDWLPYQHRVVADIDGKTVPLPFNLTSLRTLWSGTEGERAETRLIDAVGYGGRVPVLTLLEHDDACLRALGEYVYEKVFLHYTMKQWGQRPEEIDRAVTGRVPVLVSHDDRYFRDLHQGIPADGYSALVERMLDHPNIAVATGVDYREVLGQVRFDRMAYTGPIDEFFEGRFGWLPYRSLRFENRTLDHDRHQSVAVKNYPGGEAFTRVIEHAHFRDEHTGRTTITYEYPEAYERERNEPYYPLPKPETHRLYERYAEAAGAVAGTVLFSGRLAEYRYYDMDQAVAHALVAFRNFVQSHLRDPAPRRPETLEEVAP